MNMRAAVNVGLEALELVSAHERAIGHDYDAVRRYDDASDALRKLLERTAEREAEKAAS